MVMTPVTAMKSWNVCHIKDILAEKRIYRVIITTSITTEHLGSCNSQLKWRFSDYVISGIADELVTQLKAAHLVYLRPLMKL